MVCDVSFFSAVLREQAMCGERGDYCVPDLIVADPDGKRMIPYTPAADERCIDADTGLEVHQLSLKRQSCPVKRHVLRLPLLGKDQNGGAFLISLKTVAQLTKMDR